MPDDINSLVQSNYLPNNDIINIDLTLGQSQLIQALQKQYPQLNNSEIQAVGNVVLSEVSRRIGNGDPIAFLSKDENNRDIMAFLRVEVENRNSNILGEGFKG